jgi:hypothetical protein
VAELVLQARTLPEPLFRLIPTDKIKIRQSNGEIHLIPFEDSAKSQSILPILGMYTDGKLTVDGFLERSRADKELER